jgi:hypothetical protein
MPPRGRIHWYADTLSPKLFTFLILTERGLRHYVDDKAQEVEDYAKANAPWEDRTGDAREGLTAESRHQGVHHYIDLFHTVDYGIWLEIRWDGTYAIIEPTLQHFGPSVVGGLSWTEMLFDG